MEREKVATRTFVVQLRLEKDGVLKFLTNVQTGTSAEQVCATEAVDYAEMLGGKPGAVITDQQGKAFSHMMIQGLSVKVSVW